jgi:hypothetical protein
MNQRGTKTNFVTGFRNRRAQEETHKQVSDRQEK